MTVSVRSRIRCDCEGGLGGDGLATEKWLGSRVCKECKRLDQIRTDRKPKEKKEKEPRQTVTMEKFIYHHYNKFVVKRRINEKMTYLGSFETMEEAVEFRNKTINL